MSATVQIPLRPDLTAPARLVAHVKVFLSPAAGRGRTINPATQRPSRPVQAAKE